MHEPAPAARSRGRKSFAKQPETLALAILHVEIVAGRRRPRARSTIAARCVPALHRRRARAGARRQRKRSGGPSGVSPPPRSAPAARTAAKGAKARRFHADSGTARPPPSPRARGRRRAEAPRRALEMRRLRINSQHAAGAEPRAEPIDEIVEAAAVFALSLGETGMPLLEMLLEMLLRRIAALDARSAPQLQPRIAPVPSRPFPIPRSPRPAVVDFHQFAVDLRRPPARRVGLRLLQFRRQFLLARFQFRNFLFERGDAFLDFLSFARTRLPVSGLDAALFLAINGDASEGGVPRP